MNRPFQCGAITIGWSGDEGPYHLLLTPIEIRQHSYNVSPQRAERDDSVKRSETIREKDLAIGRSRSGKRSYRKRGGLGGGSSTQDKTNE